MHTPSIIQVLVSGLLATSAVSGFPVAGLRNLSRRSAVGSILALAVPAYAAPAAVQERAPELHHAQAQGQAQDEALEARHHKGKGKDNKNN